MNDSAASFSTRAWGPRARTRGGIGSPAWGSADCSTIVFLRSSSCTCTRLRLRPGAVGRLRAASGCCGSTPE